MGTFQIYVGNILGISEAYLRYILKIYEVYIRHIYTYKARHVCVFVLAKIILPPTSVLLFLQYLPNLAQYFTMCEFASLPLPPNLKRHTWVINYPSYMTLDDYHEGN